MERSLPAHDERPGSRPGPGAYRPTSTPDGTARSVNTDIHSYDPVQRTFQWIGF
jgi:hypothetical protein